MHEMTFEIEHTVPGSPEPEVTKCWIYGKDIQFAGIELEIAEDLEVHPDATDDGIEYLITEIVGGSEYGVVRTDMTAQQMQEACWAASEMLAWHKYDLTEQHYLGGYEGYDFE